MWSAALNLYFLVAGPYLKTNNMFPQLYLAPSLLTWHWPGTVPSWCYILHFIRATFVPSIGFRREQLTTPWEVVSHDWYFGERDT